MRCAALRRLLRHHACSGPTPAAAPRLLQHCACSGTAPAAAPRPSALQVTRLGAGGETGDGEGDADLEGLLQGLNKGYKTRADGSKTSYFDRSEMLDEKTKVSVA